VERGFNGDAVSHFPVKTFGEFGPGNATLTILRKLIPLIVGNLKFRVYLTVIFHVDYKLGKEILLILVDAAEPVIVSDSLDARNSRDFVVVGDGHKVHQAHSVDHDQPVGAGNFDAAIKGAPHDGQKRKENQGDCKRPDGQNQANLFAKQICKNQPAEFHAA